MKISMAPGTFRLTRKPPWTSITKSTHIPAAIAWRTRLGRRAVPIAVNGADSRSPLSFARIPRSS